MGKVSWNSVNKKQNGLKQIENEKHKNLLELEPNFPGVATPQSSEWIIYIISYAYNPFTSPWGDGGTLHAPILYQERRVQDSAGPLLHSYYQSSWKYKYPCTRYLI